MSQQATESDTHLAPPEGLEDAAFFFNELRDEVGVWSQKNFGTQLSHRPAMGIVEELCELEEAMGELDVAKTLDAVGDVTIYMADYFYRRGWDFGEVWQDRAPAGPYWQVRSMIGLLCHSHLKGEQNIRGGTEKHDRALKEVCGRVLRHLDAVCMFMDQDYIGVVQGIWAVVSTRDWTKNPNTAHEVAELGSQAMMDEVDSAIRELELGDLQVSGESPFPPTPSAFPKDEVVSRDKENGIGGFPQNYYEVGEDEVHE